MDPKVLFKEVELLGVRSRIGVDSRCAIIEDRHIRMDKKNDHLSKEIGSTGTGCGPAAAERAMRITRQAKDLPELKDYTTDVPLEINEAINKGDNVLLEGSQGYGLSLFYGTYPYVTSKDTTASQIASDIGVGPTKIDETIVVFKAFPTRVGEGPFKTQMSEEEVRRLKIEEFGTVTGRARRIGLWDQKMAKYSAMINGATQIAVTGLDKLDPTVRGVNDFEELTQKVKTFVDQNEREIGIPFTLLSTGPDISEIVDLREEKLRRT